ncbi:ATP-binding protein [Kitasatospora acidiphila]|uniref:ATP-binding protein n=1 Tax=Kitasatospora acidiphila TaxID=2567942 RepID=UPI003C786FE4
MSLVPLPVPHLDDPSSIPIDGIRLTLVARATLRSARHRLRDHLTAHGLDPEDACLVLSELAGNSLLHAGETAAVAWHLVGDLLHLTVADSAALSLPVLQGGCAREGGRGLLLVEQLTDEWGVRPLGTLGKETWCTVRLTAA